MQQKYLPATLLVVGLGLGLLGGYALAPSGSVSPSEVGDSVNVVEIQRELADANAKLDRVKNAFPYATTSIVGSVVSVSEGSLVLGQVQSSNPILDIGETLEVKINDATRIIRQNYKDNATFAAEQAAFFAQLGPDGLVAQGVEVPQPYVEEAITLSEIEETNLLRVETDEDIDGATSITATIINLLASAPVEGL